MLLSGGIGAGKTVLAKGIGAGLGVAETMTSPTFTIVQEYLGSAPVLHVDLYRISTDDEFDQLALEESMRRSVTLIEWPEHAHRALPVDAHRITITIADDGSRRIDVPDALLPDETQ